MQLPVSEHPSFPRLRNTVPQHGANSDSDWDDGFYYVEEEVSPGRRGGRLRAAESMDERVLWGGTVVWEFEDVPLPHPPSATAPAQYENELHIQGLQIHDSEPSLNSIPGGGEEDEATHAHPDFHAQQDINPNIVSARSRSTPIRRTGTENYTRTEYPDAGIVAYSLTNRDLDRRRAFREMVRLVGRRGVEFRSERRGDDGYGFEYGFPGSTHARSRSVSPGEWRGGQNGIARDRGVRGARGDGMQRAGGRDVYRNRNRGLGRGGREWRSSGDMGRGPMRAEVEDELACFGRLGDSIWAD
jgi:hypothetical protein